ncbi:MAG: hypothetical protein DWQ20_00970 [Actinobacteria bacterium]|nr:MAG: hypothetical protein DWQ20_00970 [Actinomycetota bacterium]
MAFLPLLVAGVGMGGGTGPSQPVLICVSMGRVVDQIPHGKTVDLITAGRVADLIPLGKTECDHG